MAIHKRVKRNLARLLCLIVGLLVCYQLVRHTAPAQDQDHVVAERSLPVSRVHSLVSREPIPTVWKGSRVAIAEFAPYHEGEYR